MALTAPTIVRPIYTKNQYFVYTPLGDGNRYARWTLKWPETPATTLYPLAEVDIGVVYTGRSQGYDRKSGESGVPMTEADLLGWNGIGTAVNGLWIEWDIPDGHDRVHVIVSTRSTYGVWNITNPGQGGTTGLDVTTIDLDDPSYIDNGIMEFVIATSMSGVGNTLRFTADTTDGIVYILGVHSFDTDNPGDPSTVDGVDGLAVGHDLIDILDESDITGSTHDKWLMRNLPVSDFMDNAMTDNIADIAVNWAPNGMAKKFTSYGSAHYSGADAQFTALTNPVLFVNGVSQGDISNVANVACGEIHTDGRLSIYVSGYGDYTLGGGQGANDLLELHIEYTFTSGGLGIAIILDWTGDCDVDTLVSPAVPLIAGDTGVAIFPPNTTEYPFTVGDVTSDYDEETNMVSLRIKDKNYKVDCTSIGPSINMWEQNSGTKLKMDAFYDIAAMIGGADPNGVQWAVGGTISVQNYNTQPLNSSINIMQGSPITGAF